MQRSIFLTQDIPLREHRFCLARSLLGVQQNAWAFAKKSGRTLRNPTDGGMSWDWPPWPSAKRLVTSGWMLVVSSKLCFFHFLLMEGLYSPVSSPVSWLVYWKGAETCWNHHLEYQCFLLPVERNLSNSHAKNSLRGWVSFKLQRERSYDDIQTKQLFAYEIEEGG